MAASSEVRFEQYIVEHGLATEDELKAVSYTHLTLPTSDLV